MNECHSHAPPTEAAPYWRSLEEPRALISEMEGNNLPAKHDGAAKDTGQYNYSTVYVALAMLPWSTAVGPEPAHIRSSCP